MNKQFVTYEIAKNLKELGFNEACLSLITPKGNLEPITLEEWEKVSGTIPAPLWQQAIDWLREKHGLMFNFTNNNRHWNISPYHTENKGRELHLQFHEETFAVDPYDWELKTYEQAREAAILKALELIK